MSSSAVYVRVSTDGQEVGGTSLDTQQEACLRLAAERGLAVDSSHVYRETFTGALYRERPALTRLREAARRGEFQAVIIYAFDRLSRDQVHLAVLVDELEHEGVEIACVTEVFDKTPTGQLLRNVMGFHAEMERLKIAERTQRGKLERVRRGKLSPRFKPLYGYRWADAERSAFVIHPQEAAIVRRIFALAHGGMALRQITGTLMDDHIPSPTGLERWQPTTVRQMLANPAYIGKAVQHRVTLVRKPNGGYHKQVRPAEEQIPVPDGIIPPLVTPAVFEAVQRQLARNKEEAARNNPHPADTLLRCGMAICGLCGRNLRVHRNRTYTGPGYVCGDYHRAARHGCKGVFISTRLLDEAVWRFVEGIIDDYSAILQALEALQQRLKDPSLHELRPIEESIRRADGAIDSLVDALKGEQLRGRARDRIVEELRELEVQREELEAELAQVKRGQLDWERQREELEEFVEWCRQMRRHREEATYEDKRRACRILGIKATVWRTDDPDHDRYEITMGVPDFMTTTSCGAEI